MKLSSLKPHNRRGPRRGERGTTLMEMLVSMAMFSVVGVGLVGVSTSALRDLSLESRTTLETFELKRGLELLSTELRMSSMLSPYLPGTVETAANCSSAVAVTARTIRFFVAVDEPNATGTGGLRPYYVGYRYDPTTRQLLRGEIAAASLFSCDASIGDPTSASVARPVATDVIELDSNGDGTAENAFTFANGELTVNLGARITGAGSRVKQRPFSTRVYGRVL